MIPHHPKSTRPFRSLSAPDTPGTGIFCRTSSSLGPTKTRSFVGPCKLPTAAPTTSTAAVSFESGFCGSRGAANELCSITIAAVPGSSGINTAAKYKSVGPAQWNGPGIVPPPLIFFAGMRSMFLLNW